LSSRPPERKDEDALGIRVTDLNPEITKRFNLKEPDGVIVVGVEAESKGGEAGVQVGDIIKEVNHQDVQTAAEYARVIDAIQPGESIQLFIRRMDTGFIVIKLVK